MKAKRKIVLLGAGSVMFTQGVVLDLLANPGGFDWELALVDIDEKVLMSIDKLIRKVVAAKNGSLIVTSSTNRCDVLPNADYVVSMIGVGGRRAWEQDVFIPRKYGIYQPVGDTAMPGGISRAMRMIPAMVDIAEDIKRLCPRAHFFSYSNPMAMICRGVTKATGVPVTGLCIGVPGSEWEIADLCGFERKKFRSMSVGVNHLTFMYKFLYEGKDATPEINKRVAELYTDKFDSDVIDKFYAAANGETVYHLGDPFGWEFYRKTGAFPAPGDRHVTEFLTEHFPNGRYYGKTLGIDAYSFEGTIRDGDAIHATMIKAAESDEALGEEYFKKVHGEQELMMDMIHALETNSGKLFSVNLPNRGAVPNLPYDAILEMPAVATSGGFRPMQILDFPDYLASYIYRAQCVFELSVEAALTGSRKLFEQAILAGGYITDRTAVSKMVDELLIAQKPYLKQFYFNV